MNHAGRFERSGPRLHHRSTTTKNLYSNSTIIANWTEDSINRWTVPAGAGFGKVFNIGKQSMSASIQGFWNAVNPDNFPTWGVNFQYAILFP